MSGHKIPAVDMLTSSPPGSPPWASRYPVGSVLANAIRSSNAIADAYLSDASRSRSTSPDCHTQSSYTQDSGGGFHGDDGSRGSGENHYTPGSEGQAADHPVDIFGTSPRDPANANYTETALHGNDKFKRRALRVPKQRQISESLTEKLESLGLSRRVSVRRTGVAETESSNGRPNTLHIRSTHSRRVVSQTDHPLECDTTLKIEGANTESSSGRAHALRTLLPRCPRNARTIYSLQCDTPAECQDALDRRPGPETSKGIKINRTSTPRFLRLASQNDYFERQSPMKILDAEDLDLENRIRSALRQHEPKSHADTSSHKSVRFDPAIISLGSERRIAKSESVIPAPTHHYEPKLPRCGSNTNEQTEEPRPNSSLQTIEKKESRLENSVHTILSLKKHERAHLRELLELLSMAEDSPPIAHSVSPTKKSLNPLAPEFQRSLKTPHDPFELWCEHTWSTLPVHPNHQRPRLPPIWIHTPKPMVLLAQPVVPVVATFERPQPMRTPNPIVKPEAMVDDGNGRETKVIAPHWANSIMEKFVAKYPLTGTVKAAAPVDSKKRHAAAIQQRLEYLLMQEREKKAIHVRSFDEENEKNRESYKNKENIGPAKQ
jgi:hypothetical protein